MFSINWVDYRSYSLIGDQASILSMANMLENKKQLFTVSSVQGFRVSQDMLGCGDFIYWINP